MSENKIIGYKKIFGFVLPDFVDERIIKMVAMGLLAITSMLLVLILFIWPQMSVLKSKKAELVSSQGDLDNLKSSKNSLDQLSNKITLPQQNMILNATPQEYSPEEAIYMLRQVSNDTGVAITSYSLPAGVLLDKNEPLSSTSDEMVNFIKHPIRLTVAAPVETLLIFIAKVESSLPLGVVSDLNLQEVTRLSNFDSNRTVQLALEITFYQANLNKVNIKQMKPFTDEDLTLAGQLSSYNLLLAPKSQVNNNLTASGSGNIFGF